MNVENKRKRKQNERKIKKMEFEKTKVIKKRNPQK